MERGFYGDKKWIWSGVREAAGVALTVSKFSTDGGKKHDLSNRSGEYFCRQNSLAS